VHDKDMSAIELNPWRSASMPEPVGGSARLVVSSGGRGPQFEEGNMTYFALTGPDGRTQTKTIDANFSLFVLPAGTYQLKSYVRPCSGNCDSLDDPQIECQTTLTVRSGETLYVERAQMGPVCALRISPR
jgi:hypothetical protein